MRGLKAAPSSWGSSSSSSAMGQAGPKQLHQHGEVKIQPEACFGISDSSRGEMAGHAGVRF